jgi:hypothetical protein
MSFSACYTFSKLDDPCEPGNAPPLTSEATQLLAALLLSVATEEDG